MASANIYGSNYDGQAVCKRISANFLLSEKPQKGKPQKALHTVTGKGKSLSNYANSGKVLRGVPPWELGSNIKVDDDLKQLKAKRN